MNDVMANNKNYLLVGIGEVLWDMLPSGKQLGGAPANFAFHANMLGGKGVVASCIGNDELGEKVLDTLDTLKLSCDYILIDKQHATGTVSVKINKKGTPFYIIQENVAWDFIHSSHQLTKLAKKADVVCFGSLAQRSEISRRTIQSFIKATQPSCLCVFDINLRQSFYSSEIIRESLKLADVLKLNNEELPIVANMLSVAGSELNILKKLAKRYSLRMIALTRGDKGSLLFSEGATSVHKGYCIRVIDTVGAGDSFTAALTLGMMRGYKLDLINEYANRVACFVCSQAGAMSELPANLRDL